MNFQSGFQLLMLSAGFEHGGNTLHRFLDGHPELYVYPFESQLGNHMFQDHLSSLHPFRYRYPEFPTDATSEELYELFFDEELKVMLRAPRVSKFRQADLQMDENIRKEVFAQRLEGKLKTRANIIAAFFEATFAAWTNYKRAGENHIYVGYCPAIDIDAERILHDFPNSHMVHVVRNPYSAYADTKKRSFPHSMSRYIMTWNILHVAAVAYSQTFPENFHIVRYEDLVANPKAFFQQLCPQIGIEFHESLLQPSWNGKPLEVLKPWGAVRTPTSEANIATMNELSDAEKEAIRQLAAAPLMREFEYDSLG